MDPLDPLDQMAAIAADPDFCPTCNTKFLVDDTGIRMCAARCTEHERNRMDTPVIDGSTYEPVVLMEDAPTEELWRRYAELGAAFRDLRAKLALVREAVQEQTRRREQLDQQIGHLNVQIGDLRQRGAERVQQLEHDLRLICNSLHEEACSRDWCSEYDGFAESLNARCLSGRWMPTREQEYQDSYIVSVTYRCTPGDRDETSSTIYGALENGIDGIDLPDSAEIDSWDVSNR